MSPAFLRTLRARRATIRSRWEALLRIERVTTPLANPDTLVYLFNQTLDEVFALLAAPGERGPLLPLPEGCACNPFRAYYVAGEQALLEALVLAQAARPGGAAERAEAVAELKLAVNTIAGRDIDSMNGLCLHCGTGDGGCREPGCPRGRALGAGG